MARFLLWLLTLGASNAWACYCTYPAGDGRCYANTACWACVPGAYNLAWQQQYCWGFQAPVVTAPPPPTCKTGTETRTEACLQNQTGSKTYTRQSTCPDAYGQPVWGAWQLTQDSCKWNPPTCQPSTQTQTLSCPAGFVGSITQQQTSTCPDPYGSPVWSNAWQTTSNTCVKSITNPSNPTSPLSSILVPAIPSAPAIVPQAPVQMMTPPTATPEAPTSTPSTSSTPQTSTPAPSQGASASSTTAGTGARVASIVQRLELVGAMPRQPSIVELISLNQELPYAIRRQQDLLSEFILADDSWLDRDVPVEYRNNSYGD